MRNALIFIFISSFTFLAYAKNHCTLQPEDYDGSKKSIKIFEKNIEKRATQIFQRNYSTLHKKLKNEKSLKKKVSKLEGKIVRKFISYPSRRCKHLRKKSCLYKTRKKHIIYLLSKDFQSEEELKKEINTSFLRKEIPFPIYQDLVIEYNKIKNLLEELQNEIRPLVEPHFLYVPEFNASLRGNEILYGNLRMEVFFEPPKDNLFKLPFLNLGFETDRNTIIYACVNLDAFNKKENSVYFYFLNTTKAKITSVLDLLNYNLILKNIVSLNKAPKARITILPIVKDPLKILLGSFSSISTRASKLGTDGSPLKIINNVFKKVNILSFLNPIQKLIFDNVHFGARGIYILPDGVKIKYAGSTLFGLINIKLFNHRVKINLSDYMNFLTLKKNLTFKEENNDLGSEDEENNDLGNEGEENNNLGNEDYDDLEFYENYDELQFYEDYDELEVYENEDQ